MKLKPEQFKVGQYIKFKDMYTGKLHITVVNRLEETLEDGDLQIWFHYEENEAYISLDLYNEGKSFAKNIEFLDENGQEDELAQLKKTIEKQSKIIAKLKESNEFYANPKALGQFCGVLKRVVSYDTDSEPNEIHCGDNIYWTGSLARKIKKEVEELEND